MGYTTEFTGRFKFSNPLTDDQRIYIQTFSATRRVKRDVEILKRMYNGEFGLNGEYGREGEYFAKDDGNYGQNHDESVIDGNNPPLQLNREDFNSFEEYWEANENRIDAIECVPGLWCKWTVDKTGNYLKWDGMEKFYNYFPWLKYMVIHFFEPWGIVLNGKVKWQGEDPVDKGTLAIFDNKVMFRIRK